MTQRSAGSIDRLGILASTTCAAHCAICALVPSLLGVLGLGAFLSPRTEWAFTLAAVAVAGISLALGYRRHRSRGVAAVLLAGIVGLVGARSLEEVFGDHGAQGHALHEHALHDHAADDHAHQIVSQRNDGALHAAAEAAAATEHGDSRLSGHWRGHVDMHVVAAGLGVLAGLALALGHVLNMRAVRCCEVCG